MAAAAPTRRRLMLAAAGAAVAAPGLPRAQTATGLALARVLCGFQAGGIVDVVSRRLADRLAGHYARATIVENRTGASGRLAVEELKRAPADGATLLVVPASVVTLYPHLYRPLSYDVFADLAPVAAVATTDFALAIGPSVPATVQTFAAFTDWCRAHPSAAQCGNAGPGSMPHFLAVLLATDARLDLAHVPYRGAMAAMQDAAAGQVAAAMATESAARNLLATGRLRVLATTGAQRSPAMPDVPTFAELGLPRLTRREWFGAFMRAGTPRAAVDAAADALQAALREPAIRDEWQRNGLASDYAGPAGLAASLRAEFDFWGPVIRASGFTPAT